MLASDESWELRLTFDRQAQKRVSLQLRDKQREGFDLVIGNRFKGESSLEPCDRCTAMWATRCFRLGKWTLVQNSRLLFEQVFECLTDVGSSRRAGRGLALNCHPRRIQGAIVARVFLNYSPLDRLGTLEAAGRIEVSALLAAMQLETTPRAPAPGIEVNGQN